MSIQMTGGYAHGKLRPADPVVLYDDTDGMAFGPIFDDRREAEAFIRWFEKEGPSITDAEGYRFLNGRLDNLADYGMGKLVADTWRAFLAEHPEAECPFDDRDYGVGYTGESDKSHGDYTEATPDRCSCECHDKKGGDIG